MRDATRRHNQGVFFVLAFPKCHLLINPTNIFLTRSVNGSL